MQTTHRFTVLAGLLLACSLAGDAFAQQGIFNFPTAPMVTRDDSLFVNLAKEYFAWSYSVSPVSATYNGVHDYDGKLPDLNPEASKQELMMTQHALQELLTDVDPSRLSTVHRYDYIILKRDLEENISEWRRRGVETSPSSTPTCAAARSARSSAGISRRGT
jgi:uncharacterized protein (DUF885 family)